MDAPYWWDQPPGPGGSGAVVLSVGLLATYLAVLGPLVDHRAPESGPLACGLMGFPFTVAGIVLLMFGRRAGMIIGDPRDPIKLAKRLTIPPAISAVAAFH